MRINYRVCNICGNQFDSYDIESGLSVTRRLGYGSKFDGDFLHLNICIECLDELIESCSVSPLVAPSNFDEYMEESE